MLIDERTFAPGLVSFPALAELRLAMRVLILVEACGGVARHVNDLCAGLHSRGIEVHLLYSPKRADAMLRVGLRRLSGLGIPTNALPMRPEPGLADAATCYKIRRYLRTHGPFDIIHGHSSKGGALARLAIGTGCRARVYTPHAFVTMNPHMGAVKRRFYGVLERWLAWLSSAVIVTSTAEYQHALSVLGIPVNKLTVIPNGIAPRGAGGERLRNELRSKWGIRAEEVVFGTVARLVPQKAPDHLLRAFAAVIQMGGKCRLVMVGDGPLQRELAGEAIRLGVAESIIWAGYIEDPLVMFAFDVFVLGSRYEGFPYVLLDALVAGLPVVTTAVGGADMVVAEGENGFVVPVDDEPAMTRALVRLIDDPPERLRMGRSSLGKAKEFHVDKMVNDTIAVYQRLLTAPRP